MEGGRAKMVCRLTSGATAEVTLARENRKSLVTISGANIVFWADRRVACNVFHLLL